MMGLFDFFKSKKEEPKEEVRYSIPTIKPEKEIYNCYAEVFKREMENVSGISPEEKEEIYKIISSGDGGFMNMGNYHFQVYEKYFKGKFWEWKEYEYWNDKFTKLGRFPSSFRKKFIFVDLEKNLGLMSVAELKELLKSKEVSFTSKAKKQDLIDLAKSIPDVSNEEIIKAKVAEAEEKERYEVYTILMRTLSFRGKGLYDYNKAKKIGVKKFELNQVYKEDKEFSDMALKENPNALPPLYPYDLSMLSPVIDF